MTQEFRKNSMRNLHLKMASHWRISGVDLKHQISVELVWATSCWACQEKEKEKDKKKKKKFLGKAGKVELIKEDEAHSFGWSVLDFFSYTKILPLRDISNPRKDIFSKHLLHLLIFHLSEWTPTKVMRFSGNPKNLRSFPLPETNNSHLKIEGWKMLEDYVFFP